jgi:hypothetical protein
MYWSISPLIIREMQIKTTIRCYFVSPECRALTKTLLSFGKYGATGTPWK